MPLPQLQTTTYTLADWETWEGRWELINGVAYDMTPSPEHQEVSRKPLFSDLECPGTG
jgi:long-subunit fatty acid transport protein